MVWKISATRTYLQTPSAIPDFCVCVCGFVFFFNPARLMHSAISNTGPLHLPRRRPVCNMRREFSPAPADMLMVNVPYSSILASKYKSLLAF